MATTPRRCQESEVKTAIDLLLLGTVVGIAVLIDLNAALIVC